MKTAHHLQFLCVCACMWACTMVCAEAGESFQEVGSLSPSILLYSLTSAVPRISAQLPREPPHNSLSPSPPPHPSAGITDPCCHTWLSLPGFLGLNSGRDACVASTYSCRVILPGLNSYSFFFGGQAEKRPRGLMHARQDLPLSCTPVSDWKGF